MAVTLIRTKWDGGELVFYDSATGNEIFRIKDGTDGLTFTRPIDVLSNGNLKIAGTAVTATAAELNLLDGSIAGTVVASKALVVDSDKALDNMISKGLLEARAGAAAAAVAQRFGKTATEGLEVKVIDETLSALAAVSTDLTEDVPAGAVILSAQGNIETLCVAGGTSVKVGIGPTADPDKYGKTSAFTKNLKIDTLPDWAVLGSAEDVQVNAVATAGGIGDTAFSAGAVRVRIVYYVPNSLDNAA